LKQKFVVAAANRSNIFSAMMRRDGRGETEMDQGLYIPRKASETVTIKMLADAWKEAVLPSKRAKGHFEACLGRVCDSKSLGKGERAISTLTSVDAAAFRDELLRCDLSPSTVQYCSLLPA
jgi:hypothetical protein